MTKIMAKRVMVLQALASGRKLRRSDDGVSYHWEDKNPKPSLGGDVVSWLYRGNLVEDGLKDPLGLACGDNLSGYVVITFSGTFFMKQVEKEPFPKKPRYEEGLEVHSLSISM